MSAETDRWTEIRRIHVEHTDTYRILGGVLLVGVGVLIGAVLFANPQADGYTTNLYTEFISIAITVFVLDYLNRRRDDARRIRELKEDLLRQVRSPENSVAKHAVHELQERGWLEGEEGLLQKEFLWGANLQGANLFGANLQGAELWGADLQGAILFDANLQGANVRGADLQGADLGRADLQGANLRRTNLQGADLQDANLKGADLTYANLQGADLERANLQEAKLWRANLQGADLQDANLQGAELSGADLQGAILFDANLQGAKLRNANLQGADLTHANLQEARLWRANLQGVTLSGTQFDETTVLPDAVAVDADANRNPIYTPDSYYKPGVTDMRKYTDPTHPEFWRSDDPTSPAYKGWVLDDTE